MIQVVFISPLGEASESENSTESSKTFSSNKHEDVISANNINRDQVEQVSKKTAQDESIKNTPQGGESFH